MGLFRTTHLGRNERAGEGGRAPEHDAEHDDDLPAMPVAEIAEQRGEQHVAADEDCL